MKQLPIHFDLVKQALKLNYSNLDEETLKHSKTLVLDTLSCIVAGSSALGTKECVEVVKLLGGSRQSKVIGSDFKTSVEKAAFLNSLMGHARDYDETHDLSIMHSAVVILPAMLAITESLLPNIKITGENFLAAFAIAIHIANRIALAFSPYLATGWLPTTLFGPFGVVIGCGKLLNLTLEQTLNGFGIAYSYINGNRETLIEGELTKRMQPGIAASNGVMSVLFARKGISAPQNIFDGPYGFPKLYTANRANFREFDIKNKNYLEVNKVSLKPYPSCRATHAVIDAILEMKNKFGLKHKDIKSGLVYLTPKAMGQIGASFVIRNNPTIDAQFSASYMAALSMVEGIPQFKHFDPQFILNRKDIVNLSHKFKSFVFENDNSTEVPCEVVIELHSGKKMKVKIDHSKGSPQNPLTDSEIENKVISCFSLSIKKHSHSQALQFIETILNMHNSCDVNKLTDLL